MVVPYGFGVGDFIAVTRLIGSIVTELKKNSEAAAEYQNLIVQLEALSRALSKLNDIRPAKHELRQLDAIRAVASACERQLESFLSKISKFESTLGVHNAKDKRYEGLGRRMQWNIALKDDVKELGDTLGSHVLTINMLLMSQTLMSITAAENDREGYATNLESKIDSQVRTTAAISQRQSEMTVDLKEQKDTFNKMQKKSDALLDYNRLAYKKLDVQDKTMKDIQSEMVQANEKICSFLTKSDTAIPESSETSDTDTPILDFAVKILKKINSDTVTTLSLALLFSNAYNMSVDSQKHIQIVRRSLSANNIHSYDRIARRNHEFGETALPFIIPHAEMRRPRKFRETEPESAQSSSTKLHTVSRVGRLAHLDKVWTDRLNLRIGDRKITETICQIPSDLSFLVQYEPLAPKYVVEERLGAWPCLFWKPPSKSEALISTVGSVYRWEGGRMTRIPRNALTERTRLGQYSTATLFTERPDTDHLPAVNFNVQARSVAHGPEGWKVLSFDHIPSGKYNTYSSVNLTGAEPHLAAPGSRDWLPQLLPAIYDYQYCDMYGQSVSSKTSSAGLIGSLPLLLAMAAFSAPPDSLAHALDCIQPGVWRPHGLPSGRNTYERGMVVTVYYDLANPKCSNKIHLDRLENGDFGPFYR